MFETKKVAQTLRCGGGRRPGGFGEFFVPVDGLHHVDYISGALSARTPLIFRNFSGAVRALCHTCYKGGFLAAYFRGFGARILSLSV